MRKFLLALVVGLLLACVPVSAQTTYKGDYFLNGWAPADTTWTNGTGFVVTGNPSQYTGKAKLAKLVATFFGNTAPTCTTTQPSLYVNTTTYGFQSTTVSAGASSVSMTLNEELDSGDNPSVWFGGGSGCPSQSPTPQLLVTLESRMETGNNWPYTANAWFMQSNAANGASLLSATFDNNTAYDFTVKEFYFGQVSDFPLDNCSPLATNGVATDQGSHNDVYLNSANASYISTTAFDDTAGNAMTVSTHNGTNCTPSTFGYQNQIGYQTKAGDHGPFYASAFVFPGSASSGTLETLTASSLNSITVKSIRLAVNAGKKPSSCTTYPSVGFKYGSTTQSVTLDGTSNDPLWTGTISVSSGTALSITYTAGSGCSGPALQGTLIVGYTI